MPDTEEQRLDIIENCNYLLDGFLTEFNQTDNTPQGRMITQCLWFKERAQNHDLSLPVAENKLGSLLRGFNSEVQRRKFQFLQMIFSLPGMVFESRVPF